MGMANRRHGGWRCGNRDTLLFPVLAVHVATTSNRGCSDKELVTGGYVHDECVLMVGAHDGPSHQVEKSLMIPTPRVNALSILLLVF